MRIFTKEFQFKKLFSLFALVAITFTQLFATGTWIDTIPIIHQRSVNAIKYIDAQTNIKVGGIQGTNAILRHTERGLFFDNYRDFDTSQLKFTDLSVPAHNIGYVVGWDGAILKTNNLDGAFEFHYLTRFLPTTVNKKDFNGVYFINNNQGIVVGGTKDTTQTILRTTDGGTSWTVVTNTTNGNWLTSVTFINNTTGYAVGDNGTVLKTTNSGASWSAVTIPAGVSTRDFTKIRFINATTGFITGGDEINNYQTLLKTTDGGASWTVIIDNASSPILNSVGFMDANNGYAVGNNGTILSTTDAGVTWSPYTLPGITINTSFNLKDVDFYNQFTGAIVGEWGQYFIYLDSIPPAPSVITGNVTVDIVNSSAQLFGQINANNGEAQGIFEYGTTTALGNQINATPSPITGGTFQTVNATISSLTAGTYYYRLRATSAGGDSIGVIKQFTIGVPIVSTGNIFIDPELKAQLNGTVNAQNSTATVYFEYGTDASLGNTINIADNPISGLADQTVSVVTPILAEGIYYFRIVATSVAGTAYGTIQQFFVGENPIPNFDFEEWRTDSLQSFKDWLTISVTPVPSYDGSTAAQIDATQSGGIGSGLLLMGSFGDSGPTGGVPFTERADSVVFYANYSTSQTVSAMFGVIFKKDGEFISMNPYFLGGTSTDNTTNGQFVRIAFPISFPDATIVPDTVIILASSGNMFAQQFDPNNLLIIDNISFIGTNQNVPNSNLENLEVLYSQTLINWTTPDNQNYIPPFRVTRTTDAQHGEFAVRLENLLNNGQYFMEVERQNPEDWSRPSFAVNNKYTSLNGYYKYDQGGGTDTAVIYITMYKNGNQIGSGYYYFSENVTDYTYFSDSIIYYMNETPDSASIRVDGIKDWNAGVTGNSVLFLDNLSFDVLRTDDTLTVTGIKENKLTTIANIKIYPNPTSNYIAFKLPITEEILELNIFDVQGKSFIADNINNSFGDVKMFNVSNFPNGWYIVTVRTDQQVYTGKFIVNK